MKNASNTASSFSSSGSFRHSLDKTSKKFHCPACNKRRFVRYIDTDTGEYLSDEFGRCDREASCGYWLRPEVPASERQPIQQRPPQKKIFIPLEIFKASRRGYEANSFVTFLLTLFDETTVTDLIKRYAIGTSKYFEGACVFWFLDQFGNVVAGQIKPFDRAGHTVKDEEGEAMTTWVHSVLKSQDWAKEYNQQEKKITCLFGEHLLRANPGKPIALVESPKTAIIATSYFPKYLWMATGSLSYLTADRVKVLKGRQVILFPDLNAHSRWQEKGNEFGFTTSDILEKNASDEQRAKGLDLADFLVNIRIGDFLKPKAGPPRPAPIKEEFDLAGNVIDPILGYPVTWKEEPKTPLQRITDNYPMMRELINRLDLVQV
jgi:hypothetical protein